jgi:hypothetical protein
VDSSLDPSVNSVVEKNLEEPGCTGGAGGSSHFSCSDTHSRLSQFHSSGGINIDSGPEVSGSGGEKIS